MTRQHGYALLAAIAALVVAISAAIYTGVGIDDGTPRQETFARAPRSSAAPASTGVWVGAWAASPSGSEPGTESDGLAYQSVRNVVHTTAAGTSARVTLSNLYGQQPLTITTPRSPWPPRRTPRPRRPTPCAASPSAATRRSSSRRGSRW